MLRTTADTNIYISALQFGGQPLQLLELARDEKIVLATSPAILQKSRKSYEASFCGARTISGKQCGICLASLKP